MLKKGRESIRADTFLKLPVETVDCETLALTYPYGVSGQGYLYRGGPDSLNTPMAFDKWIAPV